MYGRDRSSDIGVGQTSDDKMAGRRQRLSLRKLLPAKTTVLRGPYTCTSQLYTVAQKRLYVCNSLQQHGWRQRDGGGGGAAPVPYALPPAAPTQVVMTKNYICPVDPSRPLSQRKVYVKIHEMCQNTAYSMLNFFNFRSVTAKAPAASFP